MNTHDFLDYLRLERNYSPLTVLKYATGLQLFEEYFKGQDATLTWETVDADVVRNWMEQLMDNGKTPSTVNGRLSTLRSFYRYALKKGIVAYDPTHNITGPKKAKPLPKFVREGDLDRLLQPEMWDSSLSCVRARTIIILFYETGMRIAELIGLNDADIDFINRRLKVTGKRNKQRLIPFGTEVEMALRQYIALRDEQQERRGDGLFLNDRGLRMTDAQVRTLVKTQLARVTTQQKRSPHVLRHTFATAMLNHGAGLESVRQLLGHASLATTEIYTHTTFEQLKNAYRKAHPRS